MNSTFEAPQLEVRPAPNRPDQHPLHEEHVRSAASQPSPSIAAAATPADVLTQQYHVAEINHKKMMDQLGKALRIAVETTPADGITPAMQTRLMWRLLTAG